MPSREPFDNVDEATDPYALWGEDDLDRAIAALSSLSDHPGWGLIIRDIEAQYDALTERLSRANDRDEMLRIQGAHRAIKEIVESQINLTIPNIHVPLRKRLIEFFQGLLNARKEDADVNVRRL